MKVIKLDKKTADTWILNKHYSRRAPIFWAGFGLVIDGKLEGVIIYGQPSPPIQKYSFKDRDFRLWELSRLVIQTKKKNAASFLIANSLKLLEQPCAVISYADSEQSHCGYVYQATNWLYTGAVTRHDKTYIVDGEKLHPITIRDRYGVTSIAKWAKENNIQTAKQLPKHRYFYICANKRDKRKMLANLTYPILPDYPKSKPSRYDDGEDINMYIDNDGNIGEKPMNPNEPMGSQALQEQQSPFSVTKEEPVQHQDPLLASLMGETPAPVVNHVAEQKAEQRAHPVNDNPVERQTTQVASSSSDTEEFDEDAYLLSLSEEAIEVKVDETDTAEQVAAKVNTAIQEQTSSTAVATTSPQINLPKDVKKAANAEESVRAFKNRNVCFLNNNKDCKLPMFTIKEFMEGPDQGKFFFLDNGIPVKSTSEKGAKALFKKMYGADGLPRFHWKVCEDVPAFEDDQDSDTNIKIVSQGDVTLTEDSLVEVGPTVNHDVSFKEEPKTLAQAAQEKRAAEQDKAPVEEPKETIENVEIAPIAPKAKALQNAAISIKASNSQSELMESLRGLPTEMMVTILKERGYRVILEA